VIELLPHVELTLTVVTLWSIWHTRRKALDEEVFQSPLSTFSFINRVISDLELIKPSERSRTTEASPIPRWLAPPTGVAKFNVGATISKNGGLAAVDAVARDEVGVFLGA
jgi:hypothetical protein